MPSTKLSSGAKPGPGPRCPNCNATNGHYLGSFYWRCEAPGCRLNDRELMAAERGTGAKPRPSPAQPGPVLDWNRLLGPWTTYEHVAHVPSRGSFLDLALNFNLDGNDLKVKTYRGKDPSVLVGHTQVVGKRVTLDPADQILPPRATRVTSIRLSTDRATLRIVWA